MAKFETGCLILGIALLSLPSVHAQTPPPKLQQNIRELKVEEVYVKGASNYSLLTKKINYSRSILGEGHLDQADLSWVKHLSDVSRTILPIQLGRNIQAQLAKVGPSDSDILLFIEETLSPEPDDEANEPPSLLGQEVIALQFVNGRWTDYLSGRDVELRAISYPLARHDAARELTTSFAQLVLERLLLTGLDLSPYRTRVLTEEKTQGQTTKIFVSAGGRNLRIIRHGPDIDTQIEFHPKPN